MRRVGARWDSIIRKGGKWMGNHFTVFPLAGSGHYEQFAKAPCRLAEDKEDSWG